MKHLLLIALTTLGLLVSAGDAIAQPQGKPKAPVDITSDPLPLKQQEQGTLQVRVTALAAMQRLEVAISAGTGIAVEKPVGLAVFNDVKLGEQHVFPIRVRLVTSDFGYVTVETNTTISGRVEVEHMSLVVGTVPPPPPRVPVGADENLDDLTLVKLSGRNAVVRFGQKLMVVVSVGDLLGRNKAEIIEVSGGRMVLDETFVGADGKPNHARVTFKEGDKGGTRVLLRPGEEPPPASEVKVVTPKPPGDVR